MERILKVTKKSGNRERDVGCCLYENEEQSLDELQYKTEKYIPEIKIAKDRKVIPDPIDDRKLRENI